MGGNIRGMDGYVRGLGGWGLSRGMGGCVRGLGGWVGNGYVRGKGGYVRGVGGYDKWSILPTTFKSI